MRMGGLVLLMALVVAPVAPGEAQVLTVDVHAHRGGAGLAPENTLAAIRNALSLGVDVIELDLHVSADGTIVVIHDATLERTTNGRGVVRGTSLADLQRLDAGAWFNPRFAGERIPTLREVLEAIRATGNDRVRLNLETKYDPRGPAPPAEFEAQLLQVLREAGWRDRVIIQSFHYPSIERVKALDPGVTTAALRSPLTPTLDPVGLVRSARADIYSPGAALVSRDVVETLHRAGIPVVPWTVNQPSAMEMLLSVGIGALRGDGIITDYPDRLIQVLRSRGVRR
jgi:glycerophosphoryl diester phosphodiesterase